MKNFVEKHDRFFQRVFEILPGVITWSVILSPIWLGKIAPLAVAFFLTFLVIYWVYRALIHLIGGGKVFRARPQRYRTDQEKVRQEARHGLDHHPSLRPPGRSRRCGRKPDLGGQTRSPKDQKAGDEHK